MSESQKRPLPVKDPEIKRALEKIYDDINSLINSVNRIETETSSTSKGKAGDLRAVRNKEDDKYYIEARFSDGWAKTELTLRED